LNVVNRRSTFLSPRPGHRASSSRDAVARDRKVPKLEATNVPCGSMVMIGGGGGYNMSEEERKEEGGC
jgi:hypothetical protein